ncbi:unnamed protein product [Sphagnum compactum]
MEIWRLPQAQYVDSVRWLPPSPGSPRLLALAVWDSLTRKSFLQLKALEENPEMVEQQQLQSSSPWLLETQNSWSLPARSTTFKVSPSQDHQHTVVASASGVGSLSVFLLDAMNPSADEADLSPFTCEKLHRGAVAGLDIQRGGGGAPDCITVGIDGKINLVKVGQSELQVKCVHDNHGALSYAAACWGSPVEFATAGLGLGLQWWDLRRPGNAVAQSPSKGVGAGGIHDIDVHPSRKHLCVAGGSAGSVVAWDMRRQQELIPLAGAIPSMGRSALEFPIVAEGEIWEVKFDPALYERGLMTEVGKVPPVFVCSEDGILALLQGGEAECLLGEPCAINGFDIDPEVGSDIVCALEHESILYLKRPM